MVEKKDITDYPHNQGSIVAMVKQFCGMEQLSVQFWLEPLMEERKCYYVCCFIEGREKTIEMPPRTGPLTLSEAEDVRKKKSSGRYHRRLRYRILDAEKNKIVGL